MASRSIAYLMERVRKLGKYEAPFLTDAVLLDTVKASIADFRLQLLSRDESRILASDDIDVIVGTSAYDLPDDCASVLSVYVDSARSGEYSELDSINWRDRYRLSVSKDKSSTRFCVRGDRRLWLYPVPTWSGKVYVDYLPNVGDFDDEAFDDIDIAGSGTAVLTLTARSPGSSGLSAAIGTPVGASAAASYDATSRQITITPASGGSTVAAMRDAANGSEAVSALVFAASAGSGNYTAAVAAATLAGGSAGAYDPGVDAWDRWVIYDALEDCSAMGGDDPRQWQTLKAKTEALFDFVARSDRARPVRMSPTLPPSGDDRY